jgi:hypothetical protein
MNKEQQELLGEAYKNYTQTKVIKTENGETHLSSLGHYNKITQEEFIGRVITNQDFAKQLGVTIYTVVEDGNIRIGINYNDKTIESYE